MEWKIKQACQKEFESGNKPGKLLAWQLKKKRQKHLIIKIIDSGREIVEQHAIKRAFYKYYANLFHGKPNDKNKITNYLKAANFPKISSVVKEALNKEIMLEEVLNAIGETKVGKSPGPDRLSARFYRSLKEDIGIYLGEVMNLVMMKKEMPKSWNQASITHSNGKFRPFRH